MQNLAVCVCRMTQSIQDMPPPEFGKAADDTAELESGDSSSISSGDSQVLTAARLNTCPLIALRCTTPHHAHTRATLASNIGMTTLLKCYNAMRD